MPQIEESVRRPVDGQRWWAGAEKPLQLLAACMELQAAISSGDPEAFVSHLPVHQVGVGVVHTRRRWVALSKGVCVGRMHGKGRIIASRCWCTRCGCRIFCFLVYRLMYCMY